MREISWNIYKSASCATLCDTIICWESQNLRENVIDLPRLFELTVGEDITCYGCGNFGADFFVCTKCYERLTRFEKAKKNVEGIKERSAVFISPLKTFN